ncbi:hypothetical protein PRIPAC_75291 [Pristionchus pacificus]|uniref:Uncharacterized protein n=1 Tax=Pristionchus pacificus TaxID=54126 RepID=A0A454XM10_PRIPA|nr:hypothetical protein PRIPAC_75291 [Pristionchus pacificus]|eukprot:PDM75096.1 hypothetical protein PRIPAC_40477 [Pristionchus pacificus]
MRVYALVVFILLLAKGDGSRFTEWRDKVLDEVKEKAVDVAKKAAEALNKDEIKSSPQPQASIPSPSVTIPAVYVSPSPGTSASSSDPITSSSPSTATQNALLEPSPSSPLLILSIVFGCIGAACVILLMARKCCRRHPSIPPHDPPELSQTMRESSHYERMEEGSSINEQDYETINENTVDSSIRNNGGG